MLDAGSDVRPHESLLWQMRQESKFISKTFEFDSEKSEENKFSTKLFSLRTNDKKSLTQFNATFGILVEILEFSNEVTTVNNNFMMLNQLELPAGTS